MNFRLSLAVEAVKAQRAENVTNPGGDRKNWTYRKESEKTKKKAACRSKLQ
jgi:hypothetical protein